MKKSLLLSIIALSAATAGAQDGISAILSADTLFNRPVASVLDDPALAPWRHSVDLSSIHLSFDNVDSDEATIATTGTGHSFGCFEASTYMNMGKATITGFAKYTNGLIRGVKASETSDAELLYPYITVDETSGRMHHEQYSFGGSYSSSFANNYIYGAELSYIATQDYRPIDPRPKNTIGSLRAAASIGKCFNHYAVSVGIHARKYKQTNAIKFVSELGEAKIYHSTGLGTDYYRFAGSGKTSYYSGWNRGVSASIYPTSDSGIFATVEYDRFTFNKILNDFNRLPLAKVIQDCVSGSIGYKTKNISISAEALWNNRRGIENIFGDAESNVYPLIASLISYRSNIAQIQTQFAWRHTFASGIKLNINQSNTYTYNHRKYEALLPQPTSKFGRWDIGAEIATKIPVGASLIYASLAPQYIIGNASYENIPDGFIGDLEKSDISYADKNRWRISPIVGFDFPIAKKFAIGVRFKYSYTSNPTTNVCIADIQLTF